MVRPPLRSDLLLALGLFLLLPGAAAASTFATTGSLELILPTGNELVGLSGNGEIATTGVVGDPDGNGQEQVDIELIALDLSGNSVLVGPVTLSLRPTPASTGVIEETANLIAGVLEVPAFSFFDVNLTVETSVGPLHTADPIRVTAAVFALPLDPRVTYSSGPIAASLLDSAGNPTGFAIGEFSFVPEPAASGLLACAALAWLARRRQT